MKRTKTQSSLLSFVTRTSNNNSTLDENTEEEENLGPPEKKKRPNFVRKYHVSFLKHGFISWPGSDESCPKPQCVVCGDILSNESLKGNNLSRHLSTKHPELETKPVAFFERKSHEMKFQRKSFKKLFVVDKSLLTASYLVAF